MVEKAVSTSGQAVNLVAEDKANSRGNESTPELVITGGHHTGVN